MRLDVVVAGVGGQGVVSLARLLVEAAVREGFDGHLLAQSGLAQLGSPVIAHTRIGSPAKPSPKIPLGAAHLVVGLERLEALRLAPYLAPDGHALLSEEPVRPYEARFHKERYPEIGEVDAAFGARVTTWIPAHRLARELGPPGLVSAVMLGALAGATPVIERDNLVLCLRETRPEWADVEVEAFFAGYRFVTGLDH
ncbi:MAG TPA: 2-oxoacid:acceptor oxidoreductase family protein [Deferrisomatales bacterium]|nr:2-oxoacid:acceptor oxidoreductase family protein [Deferrisomatales bacterium]